MLLIEDKQIDLFVGSKIGSFKHIKYHTDSSKNHKKYTENLVSIKSLEKNDGITCMEWGNAEQTEILLGRKNQQIQVYDTQAGFTKSYTADFGTGEVVGLGRYKRKILAAVSNGTVKIWSKKTEMTVDTGGKLDRMRVCEDDRTIFATGGEENDLKIWRIGEPAPIFSAKNLANDWLQLRQPVWVSGLVFMPGTDGKLAAVCSRHGYVRLYDSRAQRRPVKNVEFPNMAAACITVAHDKQNVIVGFGRGQIHQVNLTQGRPDKGYKGAAGGIVALATLGTDHLASAGLDRWLRVHDTRSKELVYKQYMTSKLSCLLVQSEGSTPMHSLPEEVKEEGAEEKEGEEKEDYDDMDQLFDKMETVGDRKKRIIAEEEVEAKRAKASEDSTEEKEDEEEKIARLLKSTEKHKRRMEQKKKEKKAKSIFHNA